MKERWVDIALISALVLIAGTIVYTLFGTSRPRVQAANTPQVTTEQAVEPTAPTSPDTPPTSEDVLPVAPSPTRAASPSESEGETENAVVTPEETPETAQEPRASLPEGAVDLERVGFSYVTGGTGSCNIVLEPWQHIAVSLDLRETYPCGTEVTITLDEEVGGRTSFRAVVADSIRNTERTVNVYVGQDEPALEYGIKDGTLSP
jgi:hypothetical protein